MINQVILVGRLTRDPDIKFTNDGKAYTTITLAVTRQFRNQNGELDTDFVQCILWRKTAEKTALYCQKGSLIGVIGRIQTRNYENQDGKRIFVTEVVAESVQFLSRKKQHYDHKQSVQNQHQLSQEQAQITQSCEPQVQLSHSELMKVLEEVQRQQPVHDEELEAEVMPIEPVPQ